MANDLRSLAQGLQEEYATAKGENIKRYQEALGIWDKISAQYEPGGGFGAGFEAQLERTKTKDVGQQIQQSISSGLFGVQTTGGAASRWESEVGQPARLQLEDMRMGRYSEALQGRAGVVERRTDSYPDFNLIADLYRQAADEASPIKVTYPATKSASDMYGDARGQVGQYQPAERKKVQYWERPEARSGSTRQQSISAVEQRLQQSPSAGGFYTPGSDKTPIAQVDGLWVNQYGERVKDAVPYPKSVQQKRSKAKSPTTQQTDYNKGYGFGGGYAPDYGSIWPAKTTKTSGRGYGFGGGL